jgi:hypothetical protein
MKKNVFLLFVLLFSCSSQAPAQLDGITPPSDTQNQVGNWKEQDVTWDVAQKDYQILKEKLKSSEPHITLVELVKVETQVVSGYNLRLTVRYSKANQSGLLQAIFFHDINQNVTLDSINFIEH